MTREDILKVLSVLKAAYPAFYAKMRADEAAAVVGLWSDMFANDPPQLVNIAVRDLIATHEDYPPNIAHIKNRIREMSEAVTGEPTDEQYWQMYVRAVDESYMQEKKVFDALPPLLKSYAGAPSRLRVDAMSNEQTFMTVTHGQFLKTFAILRQRRDDLKRIDERTADLIREVAAANAMPALNAGAVTTDSEMNDARNRVLNAIERMG